MPITTNLIHVSDETRKQLAEDFKIFYADAPHAPIDDTMIDNIISRAQAFPEKHLLDILYQHGLKAAVKILISYYALPMVTYGEMTPMHGDFLSVFDFCEDWVDSSPFHEIDTINGELYTSFFSIKKHLSMICIPAVQNLRTKDFNNKQDFLDVFITLFCNWNQQDLLMPSIFELIQSILDFPAFDLIDNPVTRIKFAFLIKHLTAYWAESTWNWYDFDFNSPSLKISKRTINAIVTNKI